MITKLEMQMFRTSCNAARGASAGAAHAHLVDILHPVVRVQRGCEGEIIIACVGHPHLLDEVVRPDRYLHSSKMCW